MIIDSHAHLDMEDFDEDRSAVIERALEGGLTHIVTVGTNLESSVRAIELAEENRSVFATVGVHPHESKSCGKEVLDKLAELASRHKVVAWGEIGLDYFRNRSPRQDQTRAFDRQMAMARDVGLPVIIHNRDAHDDTLSMLKRYGKGENLGVIHCFSGDPELARIFMDLGYLISIPGTVTFKNAATIKEVASGIPLEHMLVETDAPFLAPVPKRGKRNEPLYVTHTAGEIARLRGIDYELLCAKTSENTRRVFRLDQVL